MYQFSFVNFWPLINFRLRKFVLCFNQLQLRHNSRGKENLSNFLKSIASTSGSRELWRTHASARAPSQKTELQAGHKLHMCTLLWPCLFTPMMHACMRLSAHSSAPLSSVALGRLSACFGPFPFLCLISPHLRPRDAACALSFLSITPRI